MKIFGVTGWKNSGKTGLMERLVSEISKRGFTVSTLKHAHHHFDVDHAGKDSYRHRQAGAGEVLLSSAKRWALMHENRESDEATLEQLLTHLSPCDLVLIEGYKRDRHAKIEVNRKATGKSLIALEDPTILAVASDQPHDDLEIAQFDLDNTKQIADFILQQCGLMQTTAPAPTKGVRNDCFALPKGVNWVPVDEALDRLRQAMNGVVGTSEIKVSDADGRILAAPVFAARSNPPAANSAIDGYGFAHRSTGDGPQELTLVNGRSAAGAPYNAQVPDGAAVRILTGALIPDGVDTVVMQEDVTIAGDTIKFNGPVKAGMNLRKAGEDVIKGAQVLAAHHRLNAADLALLSGLGVRDISVFAPLRVGILSTGDELVAADNGAAQADKTYDANRPMLMAMVRKWGHDAVDLGHAPDDRNALRAYLDKASQTVDVILTSGGASAGDEDHLSAILNAEGSLVAWRIALKPGRPLALGTWQGVPLFGLPGNPVAAFVCAAIFARPSLAVMAGGEWEAPQGFLLPAAFTKTKKQGRREYLRARIKDGKAEVFQSEGSGRISGLSWASGLVELGDGAQEINTGDMVRFIPYASLGL